MTAIAISNRLDVTPFTFVQDALKGLRRNRARAAQRRHLLGLDDNLLRDMGLTRLDVLHGDF
jgi:uncharacterized protein YjiS (DUF1127 family)